VATQSAASPDVVRFDDYELDLRTGELSRNGVAIRLRPQPSKVLALLVKRAGHIVTRQEIAAELWGSQTFVDFDQGLNFAIRQIRAVLHDDADHPRYLETLPKRGYRFAAPVSSAFTTEPLEIPHPAPPVPQDAKRPARNMFLLAATVLMAATIIFGLRSYFRRTTSGTGAFAHIRSLAVLPLKNLSADPGQEYFSEGITDELITDIAKIDGLRVISHTSVERYKETNRPLPDIARELGVDAVIEGSVTRSGNRIRITAQLIDGRSDQHIWAESYERDLKDVLALQDEVAQQIAGKVGINLTSSEKARMASDNIVDPAAHEAYLKGNLYWSRLSCDGFETAVKFFQEAVTRDPTFAPAYSAMADAHFKLADWRCLSMNENFAQAEAAARKAVDLDPNLAQAHVVLGKLAFYHEWNWANADAEFSRAIELDPGAADNYITYSIFLVSMGKNDQALAMMRKGYELDPISEITNIHYVYVLYLAHRYDEAIELAKKSLELYPHSYALYAWLGACNEMKGNPPEAVTAYLQSFAGLPDEAALLKAAYQRGGLRAYWQEIFEWKKREKRPLDPVQEALYYSHLGNKNDVLQQLNLAYQQHSDGLQFLKVEPVYDNLRGDPRFNDLLARLRL